ncbi:MAG: NAD(P)-dependent oxidoreductase [Pseudomonadota bacterium]|nr:NAD(P)-dependent oxidoreductase [Pseudomonadota bacterium]
MKILVTGGAGYIGSTLVPMLLTQGNQVTVVDNFMYQQTPLLEVCGDSKLEIVRGDARDENLMASLVSKHDVILPLACLTGAPICKNDPVGATTINRDAVRMLHKLKSKHQMMLFPCTNSGYGVGSNGLHCDETTPMNPITLYGKLKVEIEKYLLDAGDVLTFRLATVFGASPRMRLDLLVNDFVYRAINDRAVVLFEPHFKRNYVHVRDVASAFMHSIKNYDSMKGQAYNVGLSDANLSKQELCEAIQTQIPGFQFVVSEIGEDPDKRNYIISNSKIEKTGFNAKVSLAEGVTELKKVFQILKRSQYSNV